jgi:hypothetical protein
MKLFAIVAFLASILLCECAFGTDQIGSTQLSNSERRPAAGEDRNASPAVSGRPPETLVNRQSELAQYRAFGEHDPSEGTGKPFSVPPDRRTGLAQI